jgi:hypothetical protein
MLRYSIAHLCWNLTSPVPFTTFSGMIYVVGEQFWGGLFERASLTR